MRRTNAVRYGSIALFSLVLSSCAGRAPPIPLLGAQADIDQLQGEWTGTYEVRSGAARSGSLFFDLKAAADTAYGMVMMSVLMNRQADLSAGAYPVASLQMEPVAIKFVRAAGGQITGELEPYCDPVTGDRLRTTFVGRIEKHRVQGTFIIANLETRQVMKGDWLAFRQ